MAFKYWNGYSWRVIDAVGAANRRARGYRVIERPIAAPLDQPPPPPPPPPAEIERVLAAPGEVMRVDFRPTAIDMASFTNAAASLRAEAASDLTDEELEALTAPEK